MHANRTNGSKLVTKSQEDELNDLLGDRTRYEDYTATWYGIGDTDGYGEQEDKNMELSTSPIDPDTKPKKKAVNLRDDVTRGGSDYYG